ncbi:MAG: ABC transporter substrate-binding protein [Candidatus Poribacteria bacterium]|nr:ABC transporter substrate-binding protein [Candidatus Poribacteria bacterium]
MKKLSIISIIFIFLVIHTSIIKADNHTVNADLNGDGVVNIQDLVLVAMHIGETPDATLSPNPDVNNDGVINILDLVLVATKFTTLEETITANTLVFGRGGDSVTLDPSKMLDGESAKVCDMIYDTLVQYRGATTDIEPALAVTWQSSADGLIWTFHLRRDIQFHDSTPFNAEAVVFSLSRPNALARSFYDEFISQITALDVYTVQIELKTPYAPFLSTMASSENAIVSPTAVAHFGENFGNNPVGTGPFKFVQWDRNDQIVLRANDKHWSGKPPIDKLVFRSIPDNSERFMELQNGNLHAMEFPNPEDLSMIRGDANLELLMQPSLNVGYLAMNMEKPPFDNLKVRLAINHAINKAEIIERLYQGTGIPAKGPIPPTLWSYDDSIEDYAYDPDLAKQLLTEAGFPDGFETTLWALPVPRPYIPNGQAFAEELQSDLQNVGINANIISYDWRTYLEKTEIGEHDMAMLGWIAGGDPDSFLYYLLSKTTAEKPALNIAFYKSDEMQDVLERARMSTDRDERIELYQQAQAIFHRDVPWVPLAHAQRLLVINSSVQNLKLAPVGWKYLRKVSLESQ